jgi:hypothetical protein
MPFNKWANRKGGRSTAPAYKPPPAKNLDIVPKKSSGTGEVLLDIKLAEQVANILEVAPFISPAASLLAKIRKS